MKQISIGKEAAIVLSRLGVWDRISVTVAAELQLHIAELFLDFSAFQAGMEDLLGRGIQTIEFMHPSALYEELEAKRSNKGD